ncbi:uncharacterized protein [Dysidea avara]|uniref:uncharacterized protein isoform X2 n=1 Tax=Dysidea avara TaxID=196820 RepID=UPI00331EA0E6
MMDSEEQRAPLDSAIHFSRILIDQGRYMQRVNLNRIADALAQEKVLPPSVAEGMKGIDDTYQKSLLLTQILQGKGEKDFKLFLKILSAETKGSKYYEATKSFFGGFILFKGYEEYAAWPNNFKSCGFMMLGNEETFIVGREGAYIYDPVHGTTLFIPIDSLPKGTKNIDITRRSGFSASNLHKSMQGCSATIWFECHPPIVFTKDVHIEIPHSFVSSDTSELCFVKYNDDMDSTGYGEILSGLFPPEYPYGVIAVRSFSAYRISTKKQLQSKKLENKRWISKPRRRSLRNKIKVDFGKQKKESQYLEEEIVFEELTGMDVSYISDSYWLGIMESSDKHTIFFSLSQYTPTGQVAMLQSKEGKEGNMCYLTQLTFQSDELVFHPQTSEDGGWRAFTADKKYKIRKSEANSSSHAYVASVKYHLASSLNVSTSPCIPLTITGGDQQVTHYIKGVNTDPTISVIHKEVLQKLSFISVRIKHNTFLQQLAMKLPHWQSTAKLLGLSEVDIQEIEVDYPTGQRQDGSFPPIFRGEQAYQALRKWTESKGRRANYGDLLVALYNATLSNEHTTDAWWYAYQELTSSVLSSF